MKSIQKILINIDDFHYGIDSDDIQDADRDYVHLEIKNGWLYEAVSHAEQVIEDLFSVLMTSKDIDTFAKDVIQYSVGKVKNIYGILMTRIWNMLHRNFVCLFSMDEEWGNAEAFSHYKESLLLIQQYTKELKAFHIKYYRDYCRYKHGLSVGLTPMQNPLMKEDTERVEAMKSNPGEEALYTFHSEPVDEYEKKNRELPAMTIFLKPGIQPHVRALHDEKNLLYSTLHVVNIMEVVKITEKASILLDIVFRNILNKCSEKEYFSEIALPVERMEECVIIGFPTE